MSTASLRPAASRSRRRPTIRGLAAWLSVTASDPRNSLWLVIGFAVAHTVLWTVALTCLKTGQDIHMDVAEAYAWGQKFLGGYGKHPPLSGWLAGVWFMVFPVADWATYALAMAVAGFALVICWLIAIRVVDRRRAFFVVVMLAIYPIFNFKGYKYNPDLLQLATLPLVVLAYLHAFEKRNVSSGVWLGLAAALALLTKYWALTLIGAIGLAALLHPARWLFLRSASPWVAIVTLAVAMIPHGMWLMQVDFVPFTYAGESYAMANRDITDRIALGYVGHNIALLALPVALALIVLAWSSHWRGTFWQRGANSGVVVPKAINVWIIQAVLAIGPPAGALIFGIYLKSDWGIPLFFLTPLALIAIPSFRLPGIALARLTAIWLITTLLVLIASPKIVAYQIGRKRDDNATYGARSDLARQLTEEWHARFHSRWKVVAGYTDIGEPMTFYSVDHPAPLTPWEVWSSGLTSIAEARRSGFIGICEADDWKLEKCEAWMKENGEGGERLVITTRRFFHGIAIAPNVWNVIIVPPAR